MGFLVAEAHIEEDLPGERRRDEEQAGRDELRRARADQPAEGAGDQKAEEGEENDCCDHRALNL